MVRISSKTCLAAGLLVVGLLAAELLFVYPGVFLRGHVISSVALAYGYLPWRDQAVPVEGAYERLMIGIPDGRGGLAEVLNLNPALSDDTVMFAPWDEAIRDSLAEGHVPLWNARNGCGMPFLANDQAAVLSPLHALRWVWNSPRARTFGLLALTLVAGLGTYLLLLRWGTGVGAAVFGAVVWANASALTVWLLYPLAETAAWFSWVVLGLTEVLDPKDPRGVRGPVILTLSLAAMLLAGHVPTAAQFLAAAGIGTLAWSLWVKRDPRPLRRVVLPVALGVLLALPQLLPTAGYMLRSDAHAQRNAEQPAAANQLPVAAAWSWVMPSGYGSPVRSGYRGPVNYPEATTYVGVAPIVIGALALAFAGWRALGGMGLFVLLALSLAYGLPPFNLVLEHVPFLKWVPALRWVVVAQWGVAILGALGLARLQAHARGRPVWFGLAALTGGLILAISLHPSIRALAGGGTDEEAARNVLLAVSEILAVGIAAALLLRGAKRWAEGLLILLALGAGFTFALHFNPTLPADLIPTETAETRRFSDLAGDGRVFPAGWVMRPATNLLGDLSFVTGYDAMVLERFRQLDRKARLVELDRRRPLEIFDEPLLRRAGVSLIVADRPITGPKVEPLGEFSWPGLWAARLRDTHPLLGWYPVAHPATDGDGALDALAGGTVEEGVVLVEGGGNPARSSAERPVPLEHRRSVDGLVAASTDASEAGWLVFREAADPGWRASVDGQRVEWLPADGLFMAVALDAGPHSVVFEYAPREWSYGLGGAAVALLGLSGLVIHSYRRRITGAAGA